MSVRPAAARGAAVNGDEFAEDVAVANHERRLFAAELQVLRDQPDRGKREDLVAVTDLGPPVDDAGGADAAIAADADVLADDGVRADDGTSANLRAGMDDRRGIDRHARPPAGHVLGHEGHDQLGLGHDRVADRGDGVGPRQLASPGAQRHLETQPIARHHLAPELRVVHTAQVGVPRRLAVGAVDQKQRGHLRQRLDHEDAGHQRCAGKMPLKEIFVDGDVLDGDQPLAGLVLGHRVDERRRVPVAEPVDGFGDIEGHGPNLIRSSRFRRFKVQRS